MVKRGCPQGSTFGPLMWNIFQNDMRNIISDANVSMFADDHQVFVANETTKSVAKILVDNGERKTKWYQKSKVDCDKYQAMVLGNPKRKGTLIWIYVAKKSNSHNPSRS